MASTPASIARRASSSASTIAGAVRVVAIHGRGESPSSASSSRRAVRLASTRSIARRASAAALASATARRSGSARSSASSPRSTFPAATSSASSCGGRSYSAIAIANGSAIPPASRRGSGPRYRLRTSAASGRPARSSPPTPNSRRIARSCPTLVNAAAAAPHADAMSVARARRSSKVRPSPTSCMERSMRRGRAPRRGRAYEEGSASSAPVRATSPIQTWPSANRSAFQIGARALVSSIA